MGWEYRGRLGMRGELQCLFSLPLRFSVFCKHYLLNPLDDWVARCLIFLDKYFIYDIEKLNAVKDFNRKQLDDERLILMYAHEYSSEQSTLHSWFLAAFFSVFQHAKFPCVGFPRNGSQWLT